jgi:hypothetical protein
MPVVGMNLGGGTRLDDAVGIPIAPEAPANSLVENAIEAQDVLLAGCSATAVGAVSAREAADALLAG